MSFTGFQSSVALRTKSVSSCETALSVRRRPIYRNSASLSPPCWVVSIFDLLTGITSKFRSFVLWTMDCAVSQFQDRDSGTHCLMTFDKQLDTWTLWKINLKCTFFDCNSVTSASADPRHEWRFIKCPIIITLHLHYNRHTAACTHRFSHILRWPLEPVVWFMSESRAVANEHEGYKRTLPVISRSFWMAVGLKGLYNAIFYSLYNPLRPIGSPNARNRHTAACIQRFSHILRWPPEPVVWFMSESRAVANEHEGYKRTLPIISSSFWMDVGLKGLYNAIFHSLYNPLRPIGSPMTHEFWYYWVLVLF